MSSLGEFRVLIEGLDKRKFDLERLLKDGKEAEIDLRLRWTTVSNNFNSSVVEWIIRIHKLDNRIVLKTTKGAIVGMTTFSNEKLDEDVLEAVDSCKQLGIYLDRKSMYAVECLAGAGGLTLIDLAETLYKQRFRKTFDGVSRYLETVHKFVPGKYTFDGDSIKGVVPKAYLSKSNPRYSVATSVFGVSRDARVGNTYESPHVCIDVEGKETLITIQKAELYRHKQLTKEFDLEKALGILHTIVDYVIPCI